MCLYVHLARKTISFCRFKSLLRIKSHYFLINIHFDVTCQSTQQQWCVFKGALKQPITAAALKRLQSNMVSFCSVMVELVSGLLRLAGNQATIQKSPGQQLFIRILNSQYSGTFFVLACETSASEGGDNLLIGMDDALEVAQEALGNKAVDRLKQSVWRWTVPKVSIRKHPSCLSSVSDLSRERHHSLAN